MVFFLIYQCIELQYDYCLNNQIPNLLLVFLVIIGSAFFFLLCHHIILCWSNLCWSHNSIHWTVQDCHYWQEEYHATASQNPNLTSFSESFICTSIKGAAGCVEQPTFTLVLFFMSACCWSIQHGKPNSDAKAYINEAQLQQDVLEEVAQCARSVY